MATKKLTPGKGGAKGMHKGHAYKEECKCIICKNKRKKIEKEETPLQLETTVFTAETPTFERKDTANEYRIDITYKGIKPDNYSGTLDEEKKELHVFIDKKYKKVFSLPEIEQTNGFRYDVISTIAGDVLTILVPKSAVQVVALTDETVKQFSNEQTTDKETPQENSDVKETPQTSTAQSSETNSGTSKKDERTLVGDITITDETYGVMQTHGKKLAGIFNLQKGFDHNKFMNDLTNRAIVFYCNNLK